MHSRRVGLSKQQQPPRLLSSIGDKRARAPKLPKSVHDPPVSSSDDDEDNEMREASDPGHEMAGCRGPGSRIFDDAILNSSGGSGDERAARASIKRTNFDESTQTGTLPRGTRQESNSTNTPKSDAKSAGVAQPSGSRQRRPKATFANTFGGSKKASQTPSSSGGPFEDGWGLSKHKPSKQTYKKRNTGLNKQSTKKGADAASKKAQLQVPELIDSPKKPEANQLLIIPDGPAPSSPIKSPSAKRIKNMPSSLDSSPEFTSKGPRHRQKKKIVEPPPRLPSSSPAVFKVPAQVFTLEHRSGDGHGTPDATLSDISSDAETDSRQPAMRVGDDGAEIAAAAAAVCPWCREPVDRSLLDAFSKGKRMNVRLQTRFCQKHRKQTAMETWKARNYPDVQWQHLERRFAMHHGFLLDIVNGKTSYFRSILAAKIASGQARSMKREENLNPGYYGPRGFNLMCDYLVDKFGDLLRQKAVDDRVIAGRGPAAFIQSVLVAELAVQMIKDDMGLSAEEARIVMEESKVLGEMVHEET